MSLRILVQACLGIPLLISYEPMAGMEFLLLSYCGSHYMVAHLVFTVKLDCCLYFTPNVPKCLHVSILTKEEVRPALVDIDPFMI